MYSIRKLNTAETMLPYFNIIKQLGSVESEDRYQSLLNEMIPRGYQQMAVFLDNRCVAVSGFWISTKLYSGKYVELDNVIIDEEFRGQGIGELLCRAIEEEAIKEGCQSSMLDCYLQNARAHKFYERLGYKAIGYHFHKSLDRENK